MPNAKISVIVVAYNVKEYIRRAVDSLLRQTYSNLEVILVDDGSSDGTGEICDWYGVNDQRVKVVHQENGGVSRARNAGLDAATGDYIGFVDSDDWVEPDTYAALLNAIEEVDAQVAIMRYVEQGDQAQVPQTPTYKKVPMDREMLLGYYLRDNEQYLISNAVWSKLMQADLAKSFRFPEGNVAEDILYTTQIFSNLEKAVYVDIPYYHYTVGRSDGLMTENVMERHVGDEWVSTKAQIAYLKEKEYLDMADLGAYTMYRKYMFYCMDASKNRKTKKYAKQIIRLMQPEKTQILKLYTRPGTKRGDRVRMKLFMNEPGLYLWISRVYSFLRGTNI